MNNEWNIHLLDLLVFVMFLIEYVFYLLQSFVVRDVKFDYVLKEKWIFMEIRLKCFYLDLNVFEVNVVLILILIVFVAVVVVVVNVIDYVDVVFVDDDEILILIVNVYVDDV